MFEPLLSASPAIQIHAFAALAALFVGPLALFRRRRDRLHRAVGYIWVLAMAVTIASSFSVFEIRLVGPFSPIHLLSVLSAYSLVSGLRAARRRDIATHMRTMRALYFWALGIAGLFTLLPGRIMARVLFGEYQGAGFLVVLALAGAGGVLLWRGRRRGGLPASWRG